MTANIGKGRILRVCDLCGGVDDHPRNMLVGSAEQDPFPRPSEDIMNAVLKNAPVAERGRLLSELLDQTTSDRHYDCCAASGCSHEACRQIVAAAGGKTGKALHAMLTGSDPVEYTAETVKGE